MNSKEPKLKKSTFRIELIHWSIIIVIGVGLYTSGYHTEVIGKLQSIFFYTGIFQPNTEEFIMQGRQADYNMSLLTLDGERTSLSEFKGKTIFINFWATWCAPCIAEMPNIQRLYNEVDNDNIIFVMATIDVDPQKAWEFVERKGFSFPVYSVIAKSLVYDSSVVPTTYIISPKGKIVMKHEGMANYNTEGFKRFLNSVSSNLSAEWKTAEADSVL